MSFVNAFFLAALGAMAIPVLLHFVRKMRAKPVAFSSLMFLRATPQQQVKRRRLRDVLLMTLRAAVLGLLALAFARPFLPPDVVPFLTGEENESVVLLIDNSYSMLAEGSNGSALDEAQSVLAERIDAAQRGDEIAIVAFSDFAEQLTEFDSDRELHRQIATGSIEKTGRATDYLDPLGLAVDILGSSQHKQKRVVLISDMQRAGWSGALDNWKLEPGVSFDPVRVGAADTLNRYFQDVQLRVRRAGDDALLQVDGLVSSPDDTGFDVELLVAGIPVDDISLSGRGTARFTFRHPASRTGYHQGEIRLDADALTIDDTFYVTYLVDEKPSILVIDGSSRGGTGLIRPDSYFLDKAFAPGVGTAGSSPYDISVRGRAQLRALPSSTDIVFVSNLPSLSSAELRSIERYAAQGGNVVLSFGNNLDADAYAQSLRELGLASTASVVIPRQVQSGHAIIGQVDWRHEVFAPFAGPGGGAILKPEFRRYVRVQPLDGVDIVGTFDTGDPFLLEKQIGSGSVMFFASTLGNSWTDFPINEMFVPFVYQLARHATGDDQVPVMYGVGENVALPGSVGTTWDVQTPNGQVFRATGDSSGTAWFTATDVAGNYVAATTARRIPFSVNLDRRESDLEARDEAEVYAGVVPPAVDQPVVEEAAVTVKAAEERQKLWRLLVVAALLVFGIETVLAHRGGKQKQ